ncbi:MAG: AAA family ATPase [Terriglobia bacterium]|jgi:predicted ATPase
MFDYIKIEGFRSFKSVELEMPRLAVLIGPNGGGKSNFLDLLMLMAEAGDRKLANGIFNRGGFRSIAFGFHPPREVRIELRFKEVLHSWKVPVEGADKKLDVRFKITARNLGSAAYITDELVRQELDIDPSLSADVVSRGPEGVVFRVPGDSGTLTDQRVEVSPIELAISQVKDPTKYPAASEVLKQLEGWTFYRDIDVGPESPVRQPALLRSDIRLLPNGSNLSSVFHAIQQDHPDDWGEILEIVHTAYPDFMKLTVPAEGGDGKVLLRWFEQPYEREGISANLLSDGTMKLLCLIAILKNPTPPPLICIDEPELGLHPDWIELVAELMQDAAMRTQVIVATHSPHIVAKMKPEQVIVTEKENGESRLEQLSAEHLEKWLKDFNLAELWLAGEIGGRP